MTKATKIQIYTSADLEKIPGFDVYEKVLYHDRGVRVAFQGTANSLEGSRPAVIAEHDHDHDENIVCLSGHWQTIYRDSSGLLKCVLRIPKGEKHGKDADGFCISIKPEDYEFYGLGFSMPGIEKGRDTNSLFYYGKDRRHAPLTIRTRIGCDCDFINSLNPNFLATWEQHDDGYPVVTTFTGSGKIKNISGKGFVALAFR